MVVLRFRYPAQESLWRLLGGMTLNIAGQQQSRGGAIAAAIRPHRVWKILGQFRLCRMRAMRTMFRRGSFSGPLRERAADRRQCRCILSPFATALPVDSARPFVTLAIRFAIQMPITVTRSTPTRFAEFPLVFVDIPKSVFRPSSKPADLPGTN